MIYAPTINLWLMAALFILAHYQPSAPRTYAAACFSLFPILHALLFWETSGFFYYFTGALFSLAVIFFLNCIHPISKTTVYLQRIAFAMVVTNGAGAGLWYFYFSPVLYNWAFVICYGAAVAVLLQNKGCGGGFGIDGWRRCFYFSRVGRLDFLRKIEPETK